MNNPLVVGYRGEIGKYILRGLIDFLPSAIPIKCIDIHDTASQCYERIVSSDVIFLCIPLDLTPVWIYQWRNELKGKIIIEQTSLKSILFNDKLYSNHLNRLQDLNIRSMHILFRPSITENTHQRKIILIGDKEFWCTKDLTYFFNKGLDVNHFSYIASWQEHDHEMALQQALVHRVILILSKLVSEDTHYENNTYISSEICRLGQRIQEGDIQLYQIIQQNPDLNSMIDRFTKEISFFDINNYMKGKR